MEENINSLKDAIDTTLYKYNYNVNDIDIIKKLINNSLTGNPNFFTRKPNARGYVQKQGYIGILKELKSTTKSSSNDINVLIDEYINKFYKKNNFANIVDIIKKNCDFNKVVKKIRYFNTISENDEDFRYKIWEYFTTVFVNGDKDISSSEIRCDMINAALIMADSTRDDVIVLKTLDPNRTDLSEIDALRIVDEYVHSGNIVDLSEYIDRNKILSGLLLQNLFDYVYFNKDKTKIEEFKIDNELGKINNIELKTSVLLQIIEGSKIENINLTSEEALIEVLKNSVLLYMYSNNKKYVDYNERFLYDDSSNNVDKIKENMYDNKLLVEKLLSVNDIDSLANIINSLDIKEKEFLCRLYSISRAKIDNRQKIDNSIYFGLKEQTQLYNLLNDSSLIDKIKIQELRKVA